MFAGAGGAGRAGADGGDGGDAALDSAVSGSLDAAPSGPPTRVLTLLQEARGGFGGSTLAGPGGDGGAGGDGFSHGSFTNPSGDLGLNLQAFGGGGGTGVTGGLGGSGFLGASASAEPNGRVNLLARAMGGTGGASFSGQGGEGGTCVIDPLTATVTGSGAAWVQLFAKQGDAGGGVLGRAAQDFALANRVDANADAAGTITLEQWVHGGAGGSATGGDGGAGGAAESSLDVTKDVTALTLDADATGGAGGASTLLGGARGAAGDALAWVRGRNGGGRLTVSGTASSGGVGGDAESILDGTTTGDGHELVVGEVGSSGQAFGENARASSRGAALGDSRVTVRASAQGTLDAAADASGSNVGDEAVVVAAGASGRTATASAHGESTAGAVSVSAGVAGVLGVGSETAPAGEDGVDMTLVDAATGATGGVLTLAQSATGGTGGDGIAAGDGGDARSVLDHAVVAAGGLVVRSTATGGDSGRLGAGGAAGNASAGASGEAQGDVEIEAIARAGSGGEGTDGGSAQLERVFGRSLGGGSVRVRGEAVSGNSFDTSGSAGSADVLLENAVDGETSGALHLEQSAQARLRAAARSVLERSGSFASLTLAAEAVGSAAAARADATNDAGDANAWVHARGRGARAEARATASLDGASVRIGDVYPPPPGFDPSFGAVVPVGDGTHANSDAVSLSVGTHLANGEVSVTDFAQGGLGGRDGAAPVGGAASSSALATNQGVARVEARANARGGAGGEPLVNPSGALGGDADALARASGGGEVLAQAFAAGGFGEQAGVGRARAEAFGGSGTALAQVAARGRVMPGSFVREGDVLRAQAAVQVANGEAVAEATGSSADFAPPPAAPADGFVQLVHGVSADALAAALDGNDAVGAALGAAGAQALALVRTGTLSADPLDIVLSASLEIPADSLVAPVPGPIAVGFLDPELDAITGLRVFVEIGGALAFDRSWDDAAEAEAFLDDRLLGFERMAGQALRIGIELTAAGAPTTLDFVVAAAVPEPAPLALFGVAIAAAAFASRRR